MMKRLKIEPPTIRRTKLSYILLGVGALYLCVVVLKFPDLFESVTVLDSSESGSSVNNSLGKEEGERELIVNHYLGKEEGKSETRVNHSLGSEEDASESSGNHSLGKEDDGGGRLIKTDPTSNHTNRSHRILQGRGSETVLSMPGEGEKQEAQKVVGQPVKLRKLRYGRITAAVLKRLNRTKNFTILENMADEAWSLGLKEWEELEKFDETKIEIDVILERKPESCSSWVSQTGEQFVKNNQLMLLPCGLAGGSSITIVGTPRLAHKEYVPEVAKLRNGNAMVKVSQFVVELQGLKAVSGEDPPKILHLNPRLRGDWSQRPVIEHNTCYRMQWGAAQRCDGVPSKNYEHMLDGFLRCEKWMRNDIVGSREPKIVSWFQRFIERANKPIVTWPFPFVEGRLFVLTIRAGVEGYHINVGGRQVTSFPYRMGFPLEDATGLLVKGDVDVHSVYATSLPTSHPSFSPQGVLDFSDKWKANPLPNRHIRMFIGVLSATNHFAERMAVRRTWMQSSEIKSSDVVVRFFVALNPRREVNAVLKKEAAYFGDIVILPFMDRYELVVLKTIAICEYGVRNMTTDYIMKCDDDNFVRVDTVLQQIKHVSPESALYMGNLNLLHRPLRHGKWAVSYEEWPEEVYPPYANGPGYIISIDIAKYIVAQHQNHSLRLFKMEDVSMGMWVEQFNSSTPVQYNHNLRFCQYGCVVNYFTAHYQSPRQMLCLWYNLVRGRARCCNF